MNCVVAFDTAEEDFFFFRGWLLFTEFEQHELLCQWAVNEFQLFFLLKPDYFGQLLWYHGFQYLFCQVIPVFLYQRKKEGKGIMGQKWLICDYEVEQIQQFNCQVRGKLLITENVIEKLEFYGGNISVEFWVFLDFLD